MNLRKENECERRKGDNGSDEIMRMMSMGVKGHQLRFYGSQS